MTKEKSMFVCSNCKETFAKWLGRCPGCGAWGTMQEQTAELGTKKKNSTAKVLEMHKVRFGICRNKPSFRWGTC